MTLNDRSRHNSPYFVFFFHEFDSFAGDYVTVVEYRPIMSAKYHLPVPVFHFRPKLTQPTLQRGLSAIAELLVCFRIASDEIVLVQFYFSCKSRFSSGQQKLRKWDLDIVEEAGIMLFEVEFKELQANLASTWHGDVPETLGGVSVRQRVVRRHEAARRTTQLTATTYTLQRPVLCSWD